MLLKNMTRKRLLDYLVTQLDHLMPDSRPVRPEIDRHLDQALTRLQHLINGVRMWPTNEFDYLHSTQYAIFLYLIANSIWREEKTELAREVCTKLFVLNKTLNGIDCFFEIELPEVFFIGHTVGIVLAKATYGNHLVLYQNSTVGKNHGIAPVIGDDVVLYPNTSIIGRCQIGNGTVISQGTNVINRDTPGDCLAFPGEGGNLVFKPVTRSFHNDFFR